MQTVSGEMIQAQKELKIGLFEAASLILNYYRDEAESLGIPKYEKMAEELSSRLMTLTRLCGKLAILDKLREVPAGMEKSE
jgi:hypothetical protein